MNKLLVVLLILSLVGNVIGLYVLLKALEYRKDIAQLERARRDWAGLDRYAEENKKLSAGAESEDRVVLYGASITELWDVTSLLPEYPGLVNRGIAGQKSAQLIWRFHQDVASLHPRGVVLKLCGINFKGDVPLHALKHDMEDLIEMALADGIRPLAASVLPVGAEKDELYPEQTREIQAFNDWLRQYAAERELPYVDYFTPLADRTGHFKDDYRADGYHPNNEGFRVMASVLAPHLDALNGIQPE